MIFSRLSYSFGQRSLNARICHLNVLELTSKEEETEKSKPVVVAIGGACYRARIKTTVGRKTQKGRYGFLSIL